MANIDSLTAEEIQKIATEGALIYEEIKSKYEPEHKGEFLAIEIESKKEYLASSSAEAMILARASHPNKIFYVMKIGFDAAETLAHFSASN